MKSSNRFALLATVVVGLSSLSSVALAASVNGTANAQVLAPIVVTVGAPLNFGTIAGNAAGTVIIAASGGARTFSGGVVGTSAASGAGAFTLTGTTGNTFAITLPGTALTVVSGANSMGYTVTASAATGSIVAGAAAFTVGGTLSVGLNQAVGSYTGQYPVTVEYN